MAKPEWAETRILVLAPVGRDAPLIQEVLCEADLPCVVCTGARELQHELGQGVGAVLLTEEALSVETKRVLKEVLEAQPSWSDLPVVLLAGSNRQASASRKALGAFAFRRNLTILERPTRTRTLVTVMQSALRARQRQYEVQRVEEARRKQELEQALEAQLAEERRRVGRELHDGIRQQLTGIRMLSGSLYKQLKARSAPEAALMQEFSQLVGDANLQVRQLINDLVPHKVDAEALIPALERAAAHIEEGYGLLCSVSYKHKITIRDDETAYHLFHIAQEAMANAAKHAKASQIDVRLKVAGKTLVLEVRDNGVGLPENFDKRGGMGLTSMRYRAELIGARLSFTQGERRGTTVTCVLKE